MIETNEGRSQSPKGHVVDFALLQEFENGLDTIHPESSRVPCRVLGYGEISTVFEILDEGMNGLAFKRMSIFERMPELDDYLVSYREYIRVLKEDIGLVLPEHGFSAFTNASGRPVFYIIQEKLSTPGIGNNALHSLPLEDTLALFHGVMAELLKVWKFNHGNPEVEVGIDGQVSNWVIPGLDAHQPGYQGGNRLLYLDTSTPLLRLKGVEQMDPELFLRSAPSFLVWILRLLFLKEVVDRYYDFRKVTIDLLANCYKEQKPELVPLLLPIVNGFFEGEAQALGLAPILEKEVRDYYREDAMIWRLYLSMRRLDRFIYRYIRRQTYPYLLPGKIKR